jgi:hypothetical protein
MKTDDLIALMAQELRTVAHHAMGRLYGLVLLTGIAAALLLTRGALGLAPLATSYSGMPMFWIKFGFGVSLAVACLWAAARLGRPGTSLSWAGLWPAVPFAVLWAIAFVTLVSAPASARTALVLGQTWSTCSASIAVLSVPTLIGALLVLRRMAPTRPMLAGAAAGGLAGGVAAAVYALHCPELAAPFLAVWYVLGVLAPVVAGALIGRYALQW